VSLDESGNPILKTDKLTHIYSQSTPFEKVAIDGVSLDIYLGDFIGVIGHTGSGKSTLIQHFNGLLKPTSGKIYYAGEDIWQKGYSLRQLHFNVGLVFQYPEYQLFEETVEKDIAYGPKNMGLNENEIKQRVLSSIKFVGLDESILDKSPFEISGGQKRRVAIAGIMAMKPKVLILDEPTAGLDPRGKDEILSRIKEYHSSEKVAVLLVSHSMEDIANNAEKVMVMYKSKIAMYGTTHEIFEHSGELTGMGLDVPQITRIFLSLKKSGYDVPTSVYSTEQAKNELIKIVGGQR
jgi:energy-coupling factor transport system ATP-binding protein